MAVLRRTGKTMATRRAGFASEVGSALRTIAHPVEERHFAGAEMDRDEDPTPVKKP